MKKLVALMTGLVALVLSMSLNVDAVQAVTTAKPPPDIEIRIDISDQTMTVDVDGWAYGRWRVSTARKGYHTPAGSWRPFMLKEMHYSRKYDNSPMPYSIFFLGGYAIHATNDTRLLGRPASHGCVRLHPRHAAKLYALVKKHGLRATRITIVN